MRRTRFSLVLVALLLAAAARGAAQDPPRTETNVPTLVRESVRALLSLEEKEGLWPYEGRYRIDGKIPVTYDVGGTALVCLALLYGADEQDQKARDAFQRGLETILSRLDHPRMKPSTELHYDMRVLAQAYALLLFCHVREKKAAGSRESDLKKWMPRLARALVTEQMKDGGWNYQGRPVHASFVTASVIQALLWARKQRLKVAKKVFLRARKALSESRTDEGAFHYFGTRRSKKSPARADRRPGSAGRSAICETMLFLLGNGSLKRIRTALEDFHTYWHDLAKRRKKSGTHEGSYLIAPYYFYYGHRYAAQAIEFLPENDRAGERKRLLEVILRTRDEDGTWNDRVFPRARAYGTAMVLLALKSDKIPPPPPLGR